MWEHQGDVRFFINMALWAVNYKGVETLQVKSKDWYSIIAFFTCLVTIIHVLGRSLEWIASWCISFDENAIWCEPIKEVCMQVFVPMSNPRIPFVF
ncbi:NAD(P)H-quinone oxidoreductase subunit J [Nymphaea thermarum]|nr:NAD(P)H-quinone oxidoreductase subunit J [Nymphaea thermarum]